MLFIFWNDRERRLRAGWRIVLHLLATIIVGLAVLTPIVIAAAVINPSLLENSEDPWFMALGSLGQSLAVIAVVMLANWWPDRRKMFDLGLRWDKYWLGDLTFGLMLGCVLMTTIFYVEHALGWIVIERVGPGVDGADNVGPFYLSQGLFLIVMIGVGINEELLSRGYHLKNIAEGLARTPLGITGAIIVSTLLSTSFFAFVHVMNPHSTWLSFTGIFVAGLTLATGYLFTGRLAASIGLHITWNWAQGPLLGFPVSGHALPNSVVGIEQSGPDIVTGGEFGPEAGAIGWIACFVAIVAFAIRGWITGSMPRSFVEICRFRRIVRVPRRISRFASHVPGTVEPYQNEEPAH